MNEWHALLIAAALTAAASCTFDSSGLRADSQAGPRPDSGIPTDAAPLPDACAPGCAGDVLITCDPAPASTPCPLGCDDQAPACNQLVPANGARPGEHLAGVAGVVTVPAGAAAHIDSDRGEILIDGQELRASGQGLSGGVRFTLLGDLIDGTNGPGVLGVEELAIEAGATVRVSGSRPLIILSRGPVQLAGLIDISAGCPQGEPSPSLCGGPGGGRGTARGGSVNSSGDPATGCAPGGNCGREARRRLLRGRE